MASLAQWTWVWANSGRWWRTGNPDVLQSTGSQRIGHDLVTEQPQKWVRRQDHLHLKVSLSWRALILATSLSSPSAYCSLTLLRPTPGRWEPTDLPAKKASTSMSNLFYLELIFIGVYGQLVLIFTAEWYKVQNRIKFNINQDSLIKM